MSDELRVTVVATGLGQVAESVAEQPVKLVVNKEPQVENVDYDRPTVLRKQASHGDSAAKASDNNMEYLDIPAFLRRQAD